MFITGMPSSNKDLDLDLLVISRKWEFGVAKPEGLPRVSC